MEQYNTGAHQSLGNLSPFEVFFARKPNLKEVSLEENFDHENDVQHSDIDKHLDESAALRTKAQCFSEKAAEKMVLRRKRKFPPSEYEVGENVLVKSIYSGKKIKSKFTNIFSGIVNEKDGDRYKIKYIKNDNEVIDWFPVSQITSITKSKENAKQALKQEKSSKVFKTEYHLRQANDAIRTNKENVSLPCKANNSRTTKPVKKASPYALRKNRVSSYMDRDKQYSIALAKAIKLSAKEAMKAQGNSDLDAILAERGLRTVQVEGDGNCFFRVVAHQIYGDSSLHSTVRARAVNEVASNPDLFRDFIADQEIDEFVDSLSSDREWADNVAIQAVAEAYGVNMEIINSNQRQFPTAIVYPRGTQHSNRLLVIAHIEQLHYMSTEIDIPFQTLTWGENCANKTLKNTCPVDGPLSWLMVSLAYFPKLMTMVQTFKLSEIIKVFDLFSNAKSGEGKLRWLQNVAKVHISQENNCYGSEAEQFFEPLSKSEIAQVLYEIICTKESCKKRKIRKGQLRINPSTMSLKDRIESAGEKSNTDCLDCSGIGTVITSLLDLPPIIFIPRDYIRVDDEIPSMITLNGIAFVLLLITIYEKQRNHFKAIFRVGSRNWIEFDGMEKKKEKIITVPRINTDDVGFIAFGRADILNDNAVYPQECYSGKMDDVVCRKDKNKNMKTDFKGKV